MSRDTSNDEKVSVLVMEARARNADGEEIGKEELERPEPAPPALPYVVIEFAEMALRRFVDHHPMDGTRSKSRSGRR